MKYLNTFSIAALFTCFSVMQSDATIVNVQVEDNQFNPGNFSINAGDTIIWTWDNSAGAHTTTSTSIPVTATTWDEPINQGSQTFLYIPAFAGSYDYQCNFHVTTGMTGHFTVIGNIGISDHTSSYSIGLNVTTVTKDQYLITYNIPKTASMILRLYDIIGNNVTTFFSGIHTAGTYTEEFESASLSKGVYVINLETQEGTISRKVVFQ